MKYITLAILAFAFQIIIDYYFPKDFDRLTVILVAFVSGGIWSSIYDKVMSK